MARAGSTYRCNRRRAMKLAQRNPSIKKLNNRWYGRIQGQLMFEASSRREAQSRLFHLRKELSSNADN